MGETRHYTLYGIRDIRECISRIKILLNRPKLEFDIELIVWEALINAYIHGNKKDDSLPIFLTLKLSEKKATFEISHSGQALDGIVIPMEFTEQDLIKEQGRGLYIINQLADRLLIENNTLKICKRLNGKY